MKLLLTSGGVTNDRIRASLVDLLGGPISAARALYIPTAQWGQPACTPESVWRSTSGTPSGRSSLTGLGWGSLGVLELTALPSIGAERWMPWVRAADVLLVDGGEAVYLAHWLRESGLAKVLPDLPETVWVGVSAGSMALTPRVGADFLDWHPGGDDATLGLVDFAIFPHLDSPGWESNALPRARAWAERIGIPAYAIDDETALRVEDGVVEVVSDGRWYAFNGAAG